MLMRDKQLPLSSRTIATAILLLTIAPFCAGADDARLLLVPVETSLKPHEKPIADVYIWNTSHHSIKVASLDFITTVSSTRNPTGATAQGAVELQGKTTTSGPTHKLSANAIETKRVKLDVSAEPGDLLEVYVQIGTPPYLRSNSVLLLCAPASKRSQ
jgi:hypothetical protein